jgi:hypothetical protein
MTRGEKADSDFVRDNYSNAKLRPQILYPSIVESIGRGRSVDYPRSLPFHHKLKFLFLIPESLHIYAQIFQNLPIKIREPLSSKD